MRYTVIKSTASIVGKGWYGQTIATEIELSDYDVQAMSNEDGSYDRDSVERWLLLSLTDDFMDVTDFSVTLEIGDETIEFPWSSDSCEWDFIDCLYHSVDGD